MNKIEILNDYPWFHSKAFTVAPEIVILLDPATTDQRFTNYRSLDFRGHTNFISKSAFKNIKDVLGQEILNKSLVITAAPPIHRDDKKTAKKTTEHLKEFYEELRLIVNTVKPKLVISFGNSSARQSFNKSVKITTMRGTIKPSVEFNAPVFTTYNPNIIVANPAQARVFEADLNFVKNFIENGFVLRRELEKKYYWCTDLQFMVDNPPKEIAVDTETTGLHWYKDDVTILTLQICPKPGLVYCVPINHPKIILRPETKQKLKDQLKSILSHKFTDVIGHNYKFDWLQVKSALGFDSRYDHDTQNMAHLIDENMPKNIDDCIKVFVPEMAGYNDTLNKDPEHQGKTRMDLLGLDKMLAYACGDSDATMRLYHVLKKKIAEDKKLQNCYNRIVMPTLRAFCNVEQTGMFIDEEKLAEFEEELSEQQKERQERLIEQIPETIIEKFRDTGVGIKLNRADLLIDYLFVHEDGLKLKPQVFTAAGKPSVSTKDHLSYFKKVPFVAELMTYIKEDKMLNTYLKGFWKYLKDGRIHPNYNFLTKTGRSSSREPNGQNFPKRGDSAKKFRECFVAPEGYVILEIDYSQIELRIVAAVSGDPAMIKIYKDGGDIHALTGAMVIGGVSLEEFFNLSKERRSELRYQAKSYNFGLIYGMSANGFKDYAETEYGIIITLEDAIKSRKKFFNTYSSLVPWHNAVGDFVKKHGYVRSYTGRKRNLPEIFSQDEKYASQAKRMAINSPIQGFGSELGCMTASRMADPYNDVMHHNEDVLLAGFVHDAIVAYVKKDKVLEGCRKVKKFMEDNPLKEWFGVELPVPIIAEAAIGANLANLVEIDSAILLDSKITTDEQLYETILKWSNNDDKINRNLGLIQQVQNC
jgi:DNA polymerase I-like protein with 3'-5' exonuclease and polymerase domains